MGSSFSDETRTNKNGFFIRQSSGPLLDDLFGKPPSFDELPMELGSPEVVRLISSIKKDREEVGRKCAFYGGFIGFLIDVILKVPYSSLTALGTLVLSVGVGCFIGSFIGREKIFRSWTDASLLLVLADAGKHSKETAALLRNTFPPPSDIPAMELPPIPNPADSTKSDEKVENDWKFGDRLLERKK